MTSTYQTYNPFFFKPYTGYPHPQHTYTSEPASSAIIMQNPGSVALDDGALQSTCPPPPPYPSTYQCDHPACVASYPTGTEHEIKIIRDYKNQIHSHYVSIFFLESAYLGLPTFDQYQDSSPSASSLSSASFQSSSSLDDFCVADLLDVQPHQQYLLSSSFTNTTSMNDTFYAQQYPMQQQNQQQQQQQQVSPLSEHWISPITPLMESMNGYMTMMDHQGHQQMFMKQEEDEMLLLMPPAPSSASVSSYPYAHDNGQSTQKPSKNKIKKVHRCPHCNHTSNRANNMKEHILTHDPYRPKMFACDTCQKSFARKHDMKRHVKSHSRILRRQKK